MTDFTYKLPDSSSFLEALLVLLREKCNYTIAYWLSESKLSLTSTGTFSRYKKGKIWNAYETIADFALSRFEYLDLIKYFKEEEIELVKLRCNEVMPQDAGYEVTEVKLSISMEGEKQTRDAMQDIKKITKNLPQKMKVAVIPTDIEVKAKDMSEVYLYSYCIENSLRAFIEKIALDNYGDKYLDSLTLSKEMKDKIRKRKESTGKKKWLSARGTSDIFYLDIDDLGNLIQNNWSIFKDCFESTQWITTNIREIADCRNAIAHHGYLEENERDIIRIDFIKILKQISDTFK